MFVKSARVYLVSVLLITFGWSGSVQAEGFLLTGNSGGQLQIGTGLPLPIQPIFQGGQTASPPIAFPPVLVPPNPAVATNGAASRNLVGDPINGTLIIPAGALERPAVRGEIGVFNTNPAVYQVATSIDYVWPAAQATFAPGGAPGPDVLGTVGGGIISYSGGAQAFGGAAQFSIVAGPLQGTGRVPLNATGMAPVATVWINAFGALPATAMTLAIVGASNMNGLGAPGAPIGAATQTTMFGPLSTMAFGAVNLVTPIVCCAVGPNGTINGSIAVGGAGLSNMVTGSKGFPWTTGFVTISQPGAVPAEVFFLSGTDMRVAGVGNVSLVSGALSLRALSGPNANRGWLSLTLPEPSAVLGAASALIMLGVCHGVTRRRSR